MIHVAHPPEHSQLARVAGLPRRSRVGLGQADRDEPVPVAVQDELVDPDRKTLPGRRNRIPLGILVGKPAEECVRRLVRRRRDCCEVKIDHSCLRDDGLRLNARRSSRSAFGERVPRAGPEGKLATRAVAYEPDSLQIQGGAHVGEDVYAAGDILERAGPATALADLAILEVPGGEPVTNEILAEGGHQGAVPRRMPIPAVYDDHDAAGAAPLRQEQLAHLLGILAELVDQTFHAY